MNWDEMRKCHYCDGTGKFRGKKCVHCKGTGWVKK